MGEGLQDVFAQLLRDLWREVVPFLVMLAIAAAIYMVWA